MAPGRSKLDPDLIGYLAPVLVVAAGLAMRYWSRHRERIRLKRKLKRFRPCPLGDKPEGPVRIVGKARMLEPLEDPFSGKAVIGYRLIIGQSVVSRGGVDSYSVLVDETEARPFAMDDGTGTCAVRSTNWRLIGLPVLSYDHARTAAQIPDYVRRRLQQAGKKPSENMVNQVNLIVIVQGFRDGDEVAVLGLASSVVDSAAQNTGYREPPLKTEIGAKANSGVHVGGTDPGALWKARTPWEEVKYWGDGIF